MTRSACGQCVHSISHAVARATRTCRCGTTTVRFRSLTETMAPPTTLTAARPFPSGIESRAQGAFVSSLSARTTLAARPTSSAHPSIFSASSASRCPRSVPSRTVRVRADSLQSTLSSVIATVKFRRADSTVGGPPGLVGSSLPKRSSFSPIVSLRSHRSCASPPQRSSSASRRRRLDGDSPRPRPRTADAAMPSTTSTDTPPTTHQIHL